MAYTYEGQLVDIGIARSLGNVEFTNKGINVFNLQGSIETDSANGDAIGV